MQDLDPILQSLVDSNHHIILAGDFNDSLYDDSSGLHRIAQKYQLSDVVDFRHGATNVPTFAQGTNNMVTLGHR